MRYTLQPEYDPPELELGDGHIFEVRWLTKDVEAQLEPIQPELDKELAASRKGADLVAVIGRFFDVVLKRSEESTASTQSKPSTLLKKAWDANTLSIERLLFLYRVVDGAGLEAPPT